MANTIVSTLRQYATKSPDKVFAIVESARRPVTQITYAQYWAEASGVAASLYGSGVREGDVVICLGEQSSHLLYAISGCFLLGALPSVVPHLSEKLDADVYSRTLTTLCNVSQVRAAIVSESEYERTADILRKAPTLRVIVKMESFMAGNWTPSANVLMDRNRTVLLQHSSGTTGLQKGVALSDASVMDHVHAYWAELVGAETDVIVSWLPLYHDMGLIAGFLLPLLVGIPLVLLSPFEWIAKPSSLLSAVSRYKGTMSWLPNFAFNVLAQKVREDELRGLDLSSWRVVVNCSEPIHWSSCIAFVQRFHSVGMRKNAVLACYAMAENTFAVTQSPVDHELVVDWVDERELLTSYLAKPVPPTSAQARSMVSCGPPIRGVSITVFAADGRTADERQVGEIAIRSGYTLTSYFRRPDLSQAAFQDGWFLTGDLGYVAGGELFVCGRKKDLVIVAGVNYYPQDFETVAELVQGVKSGRTVAFGVSNERTGTEDLVLVVETDPSHVVDSSEIRNEVRKDVARATGCVPREVHVVQPGWLLKTSSGKIARSANKEKFLRAFGRGELPTLN
jgi:acyl-CoA synthetase (AMP-forming)/AMP-acid ligase II